MQVKLFWEVKASPYPGSSRYVSYPLFIAPLFIYSLALSPRLMVGNRFPFKTFSQNCFCGSFGINLSMGRNTDRGKVAYNWISLDPAKAGPTLGGVVVVIYKYMYSI